MSTVNAVNMKNVEMSLTSDIVSALQKIRSRDQSLTYLLLNHDGKIGMFVNFLRQECGLLNFGSLDLYKIDDENIHEWFRHYCKSILYDVRNWVDVGVLRSCKYWHVVPDYKFQHFTTQMEVEKSLIKYKHKLENIVKSAKIIWESQEDTEVALTVQFQELNGLINSMNILNSQAERIVERATKCGEEMRSVLKVD